MSLFLPAVPPFFVFCGLVVSVAFFSWRRCWFCLGLVLYLISWHWAVMSHQQAVVAVLTADTHYQQGKISSIPRSYGQSMHFELTLTAGAAAGYRIRVQWFEPSQPLHAGQEWRLPLQVAPIEDRSERAGFSRERQALVQRQVAQGRVQTTQAAILLGNDSSLRQRAFSALFDATAELASQHLLLALTLGERQFSAEQWQGLRHSALGHLLAISGLHIGLVFGWCCTLLLPLRLLGASAVWQLRLRLLLAFAVAVLYAALAGFAIPTVRALLGLALLVLCSWHWQRFSYHRFWLLLVSVLLLLQPLWALAVGFWLSVGAVALIFLYLWRCPPSGVDIKARLWQLLGFHAFITLAMVPFTLLFFGGFSWLALLSNLLFVPWAALLAIPALLLTAVVQWLVPDWALLLWPWVDRMFWPLLAWLQLAADSVWAWWRLPELPWWLLLLPAVSLMLVWLVPHRLMVALAVLTALPLLAAATPASGWRLHLLDVGPGRAILLQHGKDGLLIDAGYARGSRSATAEQVLPYLQQQGIRQLHALLLTEDSVDALGHWPLIRQQYPKVQLITDVATAHPSLGCQQFPLELLSARFVVLALPEQDRGAAPCVIWFKAAGWRILVKAALDAGAERSLLQHYPDLRADLVLTSTRSANSMRLDTLLQLQPLSVISVQSNRGDVMSAPPQLKALQIPYLSTAEQGTIQIAMAPDSVQIYSKRARRLPYWLDSVQPKAVPAAVRR
ncbi:DNA internalization-related competence protein ComEC/Rec2 [Alkalimonas delamerensis]|uniref:DNA internalization-related competence protein ComEC/Rec2 n=1 Tax=Alkalimonas delamerensis TaxID=265981 RepID=A0ABT9GPP7_9GAMM|nr:DNA internalization-related competence protein ComEC/Rec2 [Alkalimonas delamerensis]MDP4528948.1 DNA internalization-related competence protein ComEC/Rec2 [Alkalimonas delamerensis]